MSVGVVKLTPEQTFAFIEDRLDGAGPCKVQEDLSFAALAGTDVVPNARILMGELKEGGAKLTAKGNLSRRFVATLMERFQWRGHEAAVLRSVSKVVNEHDFLPAMYLDAVLRLAGLVRKHRGVLKLTRKGRALLPEDEAGRLQAALFRTTFSGYNLSYLDPFDFPEIFGPQISLTLYLIGQFCDDWRGADVLMRSAVLQTDELSEPRYARMPEAAFERRVLSYLCWFGVLERKRAAANDEWNQLRLYRKTALYDRVLRFEVPD